MTKFKNAFTEFIAAQFITGTKPHLCWFKDYGYRVTWYFSSTTINRLGGEVLL